MSSLGYPDELVGPGQTLETVAARIGDIVIKGQHPKSWWLGFTIAFALLMVFLMSVTWLLYKGVGIWGINIPVAWGFAIINFVWWIGIGHAGTFISAILLLVFQKWRNSINRFTEAMTLFAVACAGMFPLLHLGRPWVFYWIVPYPNTMGLWPQWRSPLVWDLFAVSTYFTVSLLFWYVGLIPDLATLRDRSKGTLEAGSLRGRRAGLARVGDPLAAVQDHVPAARRVGRAAGAFRAQRGELRLLRRADPRLALHDLSAVLCRRRDLLRLCDGAQHHHSRAAPL